LDRNSVLYWSQGWDQGWSATVDGKPVEIAKVFRNFQSIAVPAGRHEIEFKYFPKAYVFTLVLRYLVMVIGAAWFIIGFALTRKKNPVIQRVNSK
jgi:uncharacterized membrane protein YfhO